MDGYVRAYAEEMNKLRKRQLEEIKAEELRKIREAMGLDPDHVSEFSDTDAKFNATEEFCDDAVIHLAPVQVVRRRDRMRTFDQFCDSFNGWYACAIGYDTVEEMKKNFTDNESVMIAQYQGLNVNELDELRKELRAGLGGNESWMNPYNQLYHFEDEGIIHTLAWKAGISMEGTILDRKWCQCSFLPNPEKAGFIHIRTKITPQGPKREKIENYNALVEKGIL